MSKILIADGAEPWRETLAGALEEHYDVCVCGDGVQALKLLDRLAPDVLIMDLMLSGMDGFSILKKLAGRVNRPKILVIGRYYSDFVAASLERFRVEELMLKPCAVQDVAERVEELLAEPVLPANSCDRITSVLVSLGVRSSQQGFRFLRTGILHLMDDPNQQLTKSLYPAIAREYDTTPANVEKALRAAIASAWSHRWDDVWRAYFPITSSGQIPRPTAGQFLKRLADALLCADRA